MNTFFLKSPSFQNGSTIPPRYTCDGEDISPPMEWGNVPQGTKSLALICDDPDAPAGTWIHWVIYNIPPDLNELPENVPPRESLKKNIIQGLNSWSRVGYGGPCPPKGTHRYFFRLYALDQVLPVVLNIKFYRLQQAMSGHILAKAEWMGTYRC